MKVLYDVLIKNIGFKTVSLVIATVFWFVGMNIHDPTATDSFNVKLTLANKERITANNLYLLNEAELERTTINFIVRGRRSQMDELKKYARNIKAVVDLSPIDISNAKDIGTPLSANVLLEFPPEVMENTYERVNAYPPAVDIRLDKLVSKTLPIQINAIGQVDAGYVAFTHLSEMEPNEVKVSGAKSVMDNLNAARVQVDLDGAREDIVAKAALQLFDEDNNEITSLWQSVEDVEILIPIMKYARIPIIAPVTVGTVAEGCRITGISLDTAYVEVTGTEEAIAALPRINLEPIEVDNISETLTKRYDLRGYLMNTKLSIRDGTHQESTVTVTVIKEDEVAFTPSAISFTGLSEESGLAARTADIPVIIVSGLSVDIQSFDLDKAEVSVDVTGLSKGEHRLPIIIKDLPPSLKLNAQYYVDVIIEEGETD